MSIREKLPSLPTVSQLVDFYLSRNGIPIDKRNWLQHPYKEWEKVPNRLYLWYELTKHIAYQEAIDHLKAKHQLPVSMEVQAHSYEPLYDTYIPGNIRFHGQQKIGEWKSKVYTNPSYINLIEAASEHLENEGWDSGRLYITQFPDYVVPPELVSNGALGVHLPIAY
tara:strand:- start:7423 stop:7923 length:501 start_codon:yes stop_codon:yes gene_type:complete